MNEPMLYFVIGEFIYERANDFILLSASSFMNKPMLYFAIGEFIYERANDIANIE